MKIALDDINISGGTQPRAEIDDGLVSEYAEAMVSGQEFPPVIAFYDGVSYWLADGFHRTHAAGRIKAGTIDAEVHKGTQRDAVLFSVGANSSHGKRRTNADKRKAVMTLLEDEEWGQWSNREIARKCAVAESSVRNYRADLTAKDAQSEEPPPPRTYTTKHGTRATMNTSNIGKRLDAANTRVEEPEIKTPERPSRVIASRGRGLEIAHEAIRILHTIPHSDGLRNEGFNTVIQWIEANR